MKEEQEMEERGGEGERMTSYHSSEHCSSGGGRQHEIVEVERVVESIILPTTLSLSLYSATGVIKSKLTLPPTHEVVPHLNHSLLS